MISYTISTVLANIYGYLYLHVTSCVDEENISLFSQCNALLSQSFRLCTKEKGFEDAGKEKV